MESRTHKTDFRELARQTLDASELFRSCMAQTREFLVASASIETLTDGQCIHARGQRVDHLIVVLTGSLAVSSTSASGKKIVLRFLEPGQASAVIALIDDKPSIHDNTAHGATTVLRISRDKMEEAMQRDASLVFAFLQTLASRARALHERSTTILLESLQVRVARALLSLVRAYGRQGGAGMVIDLKLSQEDFAGILGVTRQRINRELNEFADRKIISMAYSRIQIVNLEELRRLASN